MRKSFPSTCTKPTSSRRSISSSTRSMTEKTDWMKVLHSISSDDNTNEIDTMLRRSSDVTANIYSYRERRKRYLQKRAAAGYASDDDRSKVSIRTQLMRQQSKKWLSDSKING